LALDVWVPVQNVAVGLTDEERNLINGGLGRAKLRSQDRL